MLYMDSATRTNHSVISESISLIQAGSHWLPKKSLWFISNSGQFVSRLIAKKYRSFVCLFIYALAEFINENKHPVWFILRVGTKLNRRTPGLHCTGVTDRMPLAWVSLHVMLSPFV